MRAFRGAYMSLKLVQNFYCKGYNILIQKGIVRR